MEVWYNTSKTGSARVPVETSATKRGLRGINYKRWKELWCGRPAFSASRLQTGLVLPQQKATLNEHSMQPNNTYEAASNA